MKIIARLVFSVIVIDASFAVAIFLFPSLLNLGTSAADLLPIIIIITGGAAAALALVITLVVIRPLRSLLAGARQAARGNYRLPVQNGEITRSRLKRADDLSRAVLAFEMMRRRILELEKDLSSSIKSKTHDVERFNDELVEKEKVLQRANAQLVGQSMELQQINKELSAKNQELTETNAKLEKLDKMKTDFILIAAHELRTPIQPIMSAVHLAGKGLISTEEAWKQIASESKRLSNVANYILDVGKIESGTFTYDKKPLRIKQLIESVSSGTSKLASEDGIIAVNIDLHADDVTVMVDKDRILQAIANIIHNAVKFAKDGVITLRTRPDYDRGVVEIKIVDSGPGIPSEILPVLFSKFVTKTMENERGTGLGLFITKTIIEAHGGTIEAKNNADGNKGATFTIALPIQAQKISSRIVSEDFHSK